MRPSTVRRIVDQELSKTQLTLRTFIEECKDENLGREEMAIRLRELTGVPFSVRTFYRWADGLEKVAS